MHSSCFKKSPPTKREYNLHPDVVKLLEDATKLPPDLYHELSCEIIKQSTCSNEQLKKQGNLARDIITKRNRKLPNESSAGNVCEQQRNVDSGSGAPSAGNVCEQQRNVDSGASSIGGVSKQGRRSVYFPPSSSSTVDVCEQQRNVDSGASSTVIQPGSLPASKVPLIIREDLIALAETLYLDTEKVTEAKTHKMLSGDVCIVDKRGRVVFWCYIKQKEVCKYDTALTGLDKSKMHLEIDVGTVQCLLKVMFRGKTIVGAAIENVLESLGVTATEMGVTLRDIQTFYSDSKAQPISLGYLGEHILGEEFHNGRHSSIRDARLTAIADRKAEILKKEGFHRFCCPVMDKLRLDPSNNPKNKYQGNIRFDSCTCGVGKNKQAGKKTKKKKQPKPIKQVLYSPDLDEDDEDDLNDWM